MNSGSSAFIGSGGQSAGTASSWYQTSRPSVIATSAPVARTTIIRSSPGASAGGLVRIRLQRHALAAAPALVGGDQDRRSAIGDPPARASGEKPPNTTECTAPIRAQASIAIAASGIIGM